MSFGPYLKRDGGSMVTAFQANCGLAHWGKLSGKSVIYAKIKILFKIVVREKKEWFLTFLILFPIFKPIFDLFRPRYYWAISESKARNRSNCFENHISRDFIGVFLLLSFKGWSQILFLFFFLIVCRIIKVLLIICNISIT